MIIAGYVIMRPDAHPYYGYGGTLQFRDDADRARPLGPAPQRTHARVRPSKSAAQT